MRLKPTVSLVLAPAAFAAAALFGPLPAQAAAIEDPETELATAQTDLNNLAHRIDAAREMAGRLGLGPQTASADRSWKNAQTYFGHEEWLSTIRELNNYLNQTQVPEAGPYLRSQYMLGRSYEELGYKAKGLRAYFRYLATFLTAKEQDHDELTDVLRRMIPLAAADESNRKELDELLASITSLELPKDVEPVVFFYAAKAAVNSGSTTIASSWLDRSLAAPNDPVLKAKALYMKALIALGKKDYATADDLLSEVIQTDKDGTTRDLARLALARIAVHEKKRDTALKYYALVPEESASFKDATFESVYVHLDLKQDGEARTKAMLYVARWPDGAEALQLRMLLAYLDMRAGDLKSAGQSITSADAKLREIDSWLGKKVAGKSSISQTTLTDLMTLTGGQLPVSPSVQQAAQLFARLAEAAKRLADIRGDIRNILFTLGRADLAHLRPFWVNRAEQLATLGDDLLKVGHRLAAAERHLYDDRLDAVDKQKLQASESRRTRLLTPPAAMHRKMHYWASYAGFADLTRTVAESYDKLQKSEAELASARYLAATSDKVAKTDTKANRLTELEAKTAKLSDSLAKALELLRTKKVEDLLGESPHRAAGRFLAQYSAALHEEEGIIRKARDDAKTTAQRLNAEDAAKAWAQWEFLAGEVFKQIDALDKEVGTGLTSMLRDLEAEEGRYRELNDKLQGITGDLEGRLGQSLAYIVDQYTYAINMRFARHQKWKADIDWLTYQTQIDNGKKLDDRYQLEQQILKDNLTDLQQGVLWQWPK